MLRCTQITAKFDPIFNEGFRVVCSQGRVRLDTIARRTDKIVISADCRRRRRKQAAKCAAMVTWRQTHGSRPRLIITDETVS